MKELFLFAIKHQVDITIKPSGDYCMLQMSIMHEEQEVVYGCRINQEVFTSTDEEIQAVFQKDVLERCYEKIKPHRLKP